MQILIVGSGNVATVLGKLCKMRGHEIVGVASRNAGRSHALAAELNCPNLSLKDARNINSDICIIAVSDNAIAEVAAEVSFHGKMVLHTAGAVSKEVLNKSTSLYGVLYPLQSLKMEMETIPEIPLLIDGNNEAAMEMLFAFAQSISRRVEPANDEQRVKLHLAAVFVSNFSNHLYKLAEEYCHAEHLDFAMLYPLILETAERLKNYSPAMLQTGPAARKDIVTLEKHLRLLNNYPKLKLTYTRLTDSIINS